MKKEEREGKRGEKMEKMNWRGCAIEMFKQYHFHVETSEITVVDNKYDNNSKYRMMNDVNWIIA